MYQATEQGSKAPAQDPQAGWGFKIIDGLMAAIVTAMLWSEKTIFIMNSEWIIYKI